MNLLDDVREYFQVDDLYKVLRIDSNSSQQEIRRAYLSRSLELHPDRVKELNKKEEFKRKFQILFKIYQVLSNQDDKDTYDTQSNFSRKNKTNYDNSHLVCDEINLKDCDQNKDGAFLYPCRCSGSFILDKNSSGEDTESIFIVNCDSCSNCIKIKT